ncbi:hypothetical protein [Roseisolibacter agri]|uniref:Uncharacterized protein n=1 Tax=Roseisolibacter agri TaxID=2014610 RepID=A0AA37Q7N4_9BACT|nr:hypothetical protein [Roseisolibacter agri]GLC25247.1 hypothetical protein rosag_17600 [Roseisolibacter agri]
MRTPVVLAAGIAAGLALTFLVGTVATSRAARPSDTDVAESRAAARAVEVARIRAHFDSVLTELPARDLSALTPAQRGRRAAALATLRAYRDRGEFPHNYDFPGQAVPYFVDRGTGTLCAVAHLLAASGRRDIVDRVARTDNNVWIAALAGDTAFTAWLDANGLTLAEAARIQVPYVEGWDESPAAVATRRPVYTAGSVLAVGSALGMTVWNARSNARGTGRVRSALGAAAGAAALGMGAASLGMPDVPPAMGVANAAAGAASLFIATRGMVRHRHDLADARAREASLAQRTVVTPLLPAGRDAGAGVSVAIAF